MAEETAVAERMDTAAGEVTPPSPETPETEPTALAPETDAPETPETQEAAPPDPLAELADDDLKQHPKVKDLVDAELKAREASWRESERRKLENARMEQLYAQRIEQSAQVLTTGAKARLKGIAKMLEEGNDLQEEWIDDLAADLGGAAFHDQWDLQRQEYAVAIREAFPGVVIPVEAEQFLDRVARQGDPRQMIRAVVHVIKTASFHAITPRANAEAEKRAFDKLAEKQKTQQIKDAQANRPDGPTAGLPAAGEGLPGKFKAVREIDAAVADGRLVLRDRDHFNALAAGLPY